MKIRNGFVSNSSSSSFVMCFPKDFEAGVYFEANPDKFESSMYNYEYNGDEFNGDEDASKNSLITKINKVVEDGGIWEGEDYTMYEIVSSLDNNFVVSSMDCSSDQGVIDIVNGDVLADMIKTLGY